MTTNQISIQGVGRLDIEPDTAVISCGVTVVNPSYGQANRELNRRVQLLRESLTSVGLAATDLKTRNFSVTRSSRYNHQESKHEFIGYAAHHALELQLPLNTERVNQTVEALLTNKADAVVHVSFTVADPEPVRSRLLASAVENARASAEVIAQAAGVQLGKIANIHHGAVQVRYQRMHDGASIGTQDSGPALNAGSSAWHDEVTVTWDLVQ